ncbi:MAG: zinc metallopeptidase [Trueperaceae bacterium]|nr:MAG: zinc metallopeptidase [Trueperaceae bacterium]
MATYYLIGIVAFIGSMLVQNWLRSTYNNWSRRPNTSGLSGREIAMAILQANGLQDVEVEESKGFLSDHYDPRTKKVRLSEHNFNQASIAGMAVAAHEVGHALQDAKSYLPLQVRSALLPLASLGSRWGIPLAILGLFLGFAGLLQLGALIFAGAVLFQVVTLPVEFDASRRALGQLEKLGLVTPDDSGGARSVLTAAAMTYVAAAATSIAYLLYFLSLNRD